MKKIIIYSIFILLFVTVSCNKIDNINPTYDSRSNSFTGEEIFKGLFLLQGNYGKNINSLQHFRDDLESLPVEAQKQRSLLSAEIVKGINILDPTYFKRLKNVIQIGNFDEISEILSEGSNLYIKSGLISKLFSKAFQISLNIADEIDLNKYNINTKAGVQELKRTVDFNLKTKSSPSYLGQPNKEQCLVGFVVVAGVVWEVVAVVNVALVATIYTKVLAIEGTKSIQSSSVKLLGDSNPSITKEILITEIINS